MCTTSGTKSRRTGVWRLSFICAVLLATGCAGYRASVSPEQIPVLEAQVRQRPNDGPLLLQYSAALYAAGRCDTAVAVAQRGSSLAPTDALAPLVIGQCQERAGDLSAALSTYDTFTRSNEDVPGISSIRARASIVRRERATQVARDALSREQELTQQPPNPRAVAVLPVAVAGDSSYQPLSRGLAQMLISDLDLLQQFQLVERLEVAALLDELQLSQTSRVDPETAARMGYLIRAGQMVQGLVSIPRSNDVRLEANVVQPDGEIAAVQTLSGSFRDLLSLEKQLVVRLASQLGYQLSQAERQLILENGTQDMTAFLAYSQGLLAEDAGDYALAAQYFTQAVRTDPSFQDARQRRQAAVSAPRVQQAAPGEVTALAEETVRDADDVGADPVQDALRGSIGDLASTNSEQTAESADAGRSVDDISRQPSATQASRPPSPDVVPPPGLRATIRIIFRLP
jgi:tetratricopeptide (TPR) repeat protein